MTVVQPISPSPTAVAPSERPALAVDGLDKHFGRLHVTRDVRLALQVGARHALIGPNGAGKTTIVGLLTGTIPPDSGSVRLFGEEILGRSPEARVKAGLVRTFQITSLFRDLTVEENVFLAVSERNGQSGNFFRAAGKRADLLDETHLILRQMRLEDAARTRIKDLAYGQQRLVEIALALALRPKVLLLDEPAAGIPSSESFLLLDALASLPAEIAIMMIEHDMSLVRRFATDVTVLVHGGIILSGPLDKVMSSEEVQKAYLGSAAGKQGASR
jgi:ABC-type branched-subunit amino acid transport system ATPase component